MRHQSRTLLWVVMAFVLSHSVSLGQQVKKEQKAVNKSGVPFPKTPTFSTEEPAVYGKQLAKFADLYEQGWVDEVSRGRMTLTDAGGDSVKRTFSRRSLEGAVKGDKFLIAFLSPSEIKGVKALTFENPGSSDDNWLYLPSNKRVRRISGANNTASFQGTEFTYEDLVNLDYREFKWRFLKNDTITRGRKKLEVFKLDAVPTYADTGYSHIHVYLNRKTWRQERVDYFNLAGQHLKTKDNRDWKLKHGRFWRATTIEMANLRSKKTTLLTLDRFFVNLSLYTSRKTKKPRKNLTAAAFTKRALAR